MIKIKTKNSMANLGFILKESVMDACREMCDVEFRELITGMFNYAVYGNEPNFSTALQRVIFNMEKPAIDYNNSKWKAKKEKQYVDNGLPI